MLEHSEAFIISSISWLRLIIESIGALVIAFGILVAVIGFIRMLGSKQSDGFTRVRINFAHYLALGLEFQLGADILSTAVAPTWEQTRRHRRDPHRAQLLPDARNERST